MWRLFLPLLTFSAVAEGNNFRFARREIGPADKMPSHNHHALSPTRRDSRHRDDPVYSDQNSRLAKEQAQVLLEDDGGTSTQSRGKKMSGKKLPAGPIGMRNLAAPKPGRMKETDHLAEEQAELLLNNDVEELQEKVPKKSARKSKEPREGQNRRHGMQDSRQSEPGVYLGTFEKTRYHVSGSAYAPNRSAILIKDFTYDGRAPDATFWTSDRGENVPNADGIALAHPFRGVHYKKGDTSSEPNLNRPYSKEDVLLILPPGLKVHQLKWLSVWCREFGVNFGQIIWTKELVRKLKRLEEEEFSTFRQMKQAAEEPINPHEIPHSGSVKSDSSRSAPWASHSPPAPTIPAHPRVAYAIYTDGGHTGNLQLWQKFLNSNFVKRMDRLLQQKRKVGGGSVVGAGEAEVDDATMDGGEKGSDPTDAEDIMSNDYLFDEAEVFATPSRKGLPLGAAHRTSTSKRKKCQRDGLSHPHGEAFICAHECKSCACFCENGHVRVEKCVGRIVGC